MFSRRFLLISFLMILSQALLAQLCQGSLGDPLVNITFGSGLNPAPQLNAAVTTYGYTSSDCPNDGFYTVRNQTSRCFGYWNSLSADHTGDPNGYFMLANASFDPGNFYVDTVELACSNTTYEFAAWIMNMNTPSECSGNPIRPNLTFIIASTDGAVLQSFNTGDIMAETNAPWRQYGFFFTLPALANRVVLKIRNNAPGGCGNDLALDDITFRPCGPKLTVSATGGATELNFCEGIGQQFTLSSTISPGFDDPFLQWQRSDDNGSSWTNIMGANAATLTQDIPATAQPGVTLYRLTAARMENRDILACRVNSGILTVRVNRSPTITAAPVPSLCEGGTLRLSAAGGTTYAWTGSGGFSTGGETVTIINVPLSRSGRYYVSGTDPVGCGGRDSVDVIIRTKPLATVNSVTHAICEGETVQLLADGGTAYQWLPSEGLNSSSVPDPVASPADSTQYTVVVTNGEGCTDTAAVAINVYRKPTADAGPPKEIGNGQSVVLSGAATGTAVSYSWSPAVAIDDATKLQPSVSPTEDQVYFLTVTSPIGCGVATDSVMVKVYKGIFIPTAFTPNGDGKNDLWRILGLSVYPSYEVLLFNRWGQVVFRSKNAAPAWDGRFKGQPLPADAYPYLIKINGRKEVLKGVLMIIR